MSTWLCFRWWKEAQDPSLSEVKNGIPYAASPATPYGGPMKIFSNIFNSDISFNLRKEDSLSCNCESGEVGFSSRDYALVPGDVWLQTLKWLVWWRTRTRSDRYLSCLNLLFSFDMMDLNLHCMHSLKHELRI